MSKTNYERVVTWLPPVDRAKLDQEAALVAQETFLRWGDFAADAMRFREALEAATETLVDMRRRRDQAAVAVSRYWVERAFKPPAGSRTAGNIFVCFSDFEQTAVREAHDLVSKAELEAFAVGLDLGESYWCIERFMGTPPTVFVRTAEQASALELSPVRKQWDDAYFELAESKDEFGYMDRRTTFVRVDSKENFDKNYSSNWYYYWK